MNVDCLLQGHSMVGPPGPQNEGRSRAGDWDEGEDALIPTPPLLSPRAPATPRCVPKSPRSLAGSSAEQQPHRCVILSSSSPLRDVTLHMVILRDLERPAQELFKPCTGTRFALICRFAVL